MVNPQWTRGVQINQRFRSTQPKNASGKRLSQTRPNDLRLNTKVRRQSLIQPCIVRSFPNSPSVFAVECLQCAQQHMCRGLSSHSSLLRSTPKTVSLETLRNIPLVLICFVKTKQHKQQTGQCRGRRYCTFSPVSAPSPIIRRLRLNRSNF